MSRKDNTYKIKCGDLFYLKKDNLLFYILNPLEQKSGIKFFHVFCPDKKTNINLFVLSAMEKHLKEKRAILFSC